MLPTTIDDMPLMERESMTRAGVPRRYLLSRLENYIPVPENIQSFELLRTHAQQILKGEPMSVLLYGQVGVGKTHLACGMTYLFLSQGLRSWFINFAELMRKIRQGKGHPWEDEQGDMRLMQRATCVRVLLLDDIGMGGSNDWDRQVMDEIVNARYEKMLPTIATTNLALGPLEAVLGPRTLDRLLTSRESYLSFVGTSQRRG
jgi:DNA replication protein DnaC